MSTVCCGIGAMMVILAKRQIDKRMHGVWLGRANRCTHGIEILACVWVTCRPGPGSRYVVVS